MRGRRVCSRKRKRPINFRIRLNLKLYLMVQFPLKLSEILHVMITSFLAPGCHQTDHLNATMRAAAAGANTGAEVERRPRWVLLQHRLRGATTILLWRRHRLQGVTTTRPRRRPTIGSGRQGPGAREGATEVAVRAIITDALRLPLRSPLQSQLRRLRIDIPAQGIDADDKKRE
jgi:hypothetical protein